MAEHLENSDGNLEGGSNVVVKPTCPDCGRDEIRLRADAWEVRLLRGFSEDGEPILDDDPDYEVFDDRHFECDNCGYKCTEPNDFYDQPTS